jgi:Bacterial PH domain
MVWRVSRWARRLCWAVTILSVIVAILTLSVTGPKFIDGNYAWNELGGIGVMLLVAGSAWRMGVYPRIEVGPDAVTVVNPRRTVMVSYDEIRAVRPGSSGIHITLVSGRTVKAWAVQSARDVRDACSMSKRSGDVIRGIESQAGFQSDAPR